MAVPTMLTRFWPVRVAALSTGAEPGWVVAQPEKKKAETLKS
jgi:hypothetical protein